ncbi:transcription initiation factor TFIID subunit 5-like [Symsagittifera roscoffensis]|uniref:transcription initiation factor TFIID subunit 5-like n=1 Tax=Symsagittifera roscoffensis TaxID=84072 RepID=UPI00307BCC88
MAERYTESPNNNATVKLNDVLAFLEANNLESLSHTFKKNILEKEGNLGPISSSTSGGNGWCFEEYSFIIDLIQTSLDSMKVELGSLLFPLFCYFYIEMIRNDNFEGASAFFNKFLENQFAFHTADCKELRSIKSKDQLKESPLARALMSEKFAVTLSSETNSYLMKQMNDNSAVNLMNMLKSKMNINVYNSKTRSTEVIEASLGSLCGDSTHSTQVIKMFYGINRDRDLDQNVAEADDNENEAGESNEVGKKPKKRLRKEIAGTPKKPKSTPLAPALDRVPLPERKETDGLERLAAMRDASKRIKLGINKPFCAYCYTLHNTTNTLTDLTISEDATLLAGSFESSLVKIWSLTDQPLKEMKKYQELSQIDLEEDAASITLDSLLDDKTAAESKTMSGHRSAVYGNSFSPDKSSLLTASADSTVRLWSLYTYSNLVVFKGHIGPVWDVKFSSYGHYFASAGDDSSVRLWTQEHIQPLRVFCGHLSAVECLCYHPNSNYIFSGSADRTVRVWDVLTGDCVRVLTGHKSPITCICVHPTTGRFVVSGDEDGQILVHDLSFSNQIIADLKYCDSSETTNGNCPRSVFSLAFDRNGNVIVAGYASCMIKMWDVTKLLGQFLDSDAPVLQSSLNQSSLPDSSAFHMNTFHTKATPVKCLHFTKKNLLLVGGNYQIGSINLNS